MGLILSVIIFVGWILNLIKLVRGGNAGITLVLRIVGIFVPPFGALMGFIV